MHGDIATEPAPFRNARSRQIAPAGADRGRDAETLVEQRRHAHNNAGLAREGCQIFGASRLGKLTSKKMPV
jgi:hypothetical protein